MLLQEEDPGFLEVGGEGGGGGAGLAGLLCIL